MQDHRWKTNFLLSLQELSSIEKQYIAWIEKKETLDSPSEIVCQIFDDSGVTEKLKDQSTQIFSKKIDEELLKLSQMIDNICIEIQPDILLKSKKWIDISRKANNILKLILDESLD